MPETDNNILHQLQTYRIEPPPALFEKVWQAINEEKISEPIIDQPDISNESADEIESFKALQNYELAAPAFDFKAIQIPEYSTNKTSSLKYKKTFPLLYRLAAASIILALGIGSIYLIVQKENNPSMISGMEKEPTGTTQKKMDNEIDVATLSLNDNSKASEKLTSIRIKNNMPLLTSDAQLINPYRNDLFLTLVNYNYTESSAFLKNYKKTNKVKLDQFSYVTVSDKMAGILEKMYATKKNKKPTWKAKRTKAKLKRWKKQDEKNFDRNAIQNPIDIIDLSEFILH